MPPDQPHPEIEWQDEVPVATAFADPYYSLKGGLAETRHVFLDGNELPGRLRDGFHVAELGFGTGLNALALALSWDGPGEIRFTSFEAFLLSVDDLRRAHRAFPEVADLSEALCAQWGEASIALPQVRVDLIRGDAAKTLPLWDGCADAWFLDGFAPSRNPGLWTPEILRAVGDHTPRGGTFATYTAAGHVRRSLDAAGFDVTRGAGFAGKRHMTTGTKR